MPLPSRRALSSLCMAFLLCAHGACSSSVAQPCPGGHCQADLAEVEMLGDTSDGVDASERDTSSPDASATSADSVAEARDTAASQDTTVPPLHRVSVAASKGPVSVPFAVSIAGRGTSRVGAIALQDNVGTVSFTDQTMSGLVDARYAWPEFGYTLYQVHAVAANRWVLAWAYCQDNALAWIYFEGTDGTVMDSEPASGSCAVEERAVEVQPAFPALDMAWPALLPGFDVDAVDLRVFPDATEGFAVVDGVRWTLLPFGVVDCTVDCGQPGWWELHSILWDAASQQAAFGIVYLYVEEPPSTAPRPISLIHTVVHPDLTWFSEPSSWYQGVWTRP